LELDTGDPDLRTFDLQVRTTLITDKIFNHALLKYLFLYEFYVILFNTLFWI
jgi:hypothetical protein